MAKKVPTVKTPTKKVPKKRTATLKGGVKKTPSHLIKKPVKKRKLPAAESRGSKNTKERDIERGLDRKNRQSSYQKRIDSAARNIRDDQWLELLDGINWDRRLSSKFCLRTFCEEYLSGVFFMGWSDDQLRCCKKAESVFLGDEMFALAMPRAGGKTAMTRGALTWGTAHAHKRFPCNISASDPKSLQSLNALKTFWFGSPLLLQDFPEIAWSIRKLENRQAGARGQLFDGFNTHVVWGSNSVRYPCLLLPKKDADVYLKYDPDCVQQINAYDHELGEFVERWIVRSAGINISTYGIGGAIRGEAETHPITMEQPRPDLVVLDDVQKDIVAESPAQVDKLVMLIEGAITGLAGPGQHVSVIMPCTVTREDDASDTFLDSSKKPEYRGERCRLVDQWPDGITDLEISMDTPAGKLWNKYRETQRDSYRDFDKHSLRCETCREDLLNPCNEGHKIKMAPTQLYINNRTIMDHNFVVTWTERYGNPTLVDGEVIHKDEREISAQQHAMNLRFKSEETFPAEYQNRGRKLADEGEILITSPALQQKVVALNRGEVASDTQHVAAFVDVQSEGLFFTVGACTPDFTGNFCDYGTFPKFGTRYYSKQQMHSWNSLTKMFFDYYPEHVNKAVKTESGKRQAPLEAKIYHALSVFIPKLLQQEYTRQDQYGTTFKIQKLAIDSRWGQASDVIRRYIRECGHSEVIPYYGQAFPPTNRQIEEYEMRKGWYFEHVKHRNIKAPMWIIRPNPDGMYYMCADVDRGKDFLFNRLASPQGATGSWSLFNDTPENHELFADHICKSEYPEPVLARGLKKNKWIVRESGFDNDYLDCAVGTMMVLSYLGACLITGGESTSPKKSIRSKWQKLKRELN